MSTGPFIAPIRDDLRRLVEQAAREGNPSVAYLTERLIEAYVEISHVHNTREAQIVSAALVEQDHGLFIEEKTMDQWVAGLDGAKDRDANGQAQPGDP